MGCCKFNKKKYQLNDINSFEDTSIDIQFNNEKYIIKDSFSLYWFNNSFIIFNSINNIIYLIYTNKNNSILSYDLISFKKIAEIKYSHFMQITNFKYYLDKDIYKKELIMSISAEDNNIKLWDIKNWECLLNIIEVNKNGYLYSSCFLINNNYIYIITSNYNFPNTVEPIKIYDLKGNKVFEVNDSNDNTVYIDNYYDNILSNNYIITGNNNYVKSYDYNHNILYHKYNDDSKGFHYSIIINKENITSLIESCEDGNIRIWNFHSGELLKKININKGTLFGICLWNNEYILVGCYDKMIKLVDIKYGIFIKDFIGHNHRVITIKKFYHPKYGDCIISEGWINDGIILWIKKK